MAWIASHVMCSAFIERFNLFWSLVIPCDHKLKVYPFWWNFFDSFESIGTHRILWGEEFCAVQKTGVPPIEDRTTIRVVVSKEQWWMESMVKQIIWFEDLIPLRHLFHVKVFWDFTSVLDCSSSHYMIVAIVLVVHVFCASSTGQFNIEHDVFFTSSWIQKMLVL